MKHKLLQKILSIARNIVTTLYPSLFSDLKLKYVEAMTKITQAMLKHVFEKFFCVFQML